MYIERRNFSSVDDNFCCHLCREFTMCHPTAHSEQNILLCVTLCRMVNKILHRAPGGWRTANCNGGPGSTCEPVRGAEPVRST
jgi:hypothetical protein